MAVIQPLNSWLRRSKLPHAATPLSSTQVVLDLQIHSCPLSVICACRPKLRLLCLHGYTQNSQVFSSKIGSMRKGLKSKCEFFFVDGPFEVWKISGECQALC